MLGDQLISLTELESISPETIRQRLKDNDLKPWQKKMWCIGKLDATYIARMEHISDLYAEASLYKAFPPQEARRIFRRLEFHYTPKHASWLNMAEIEIGNMNQQCLD